MKTMQEVRSEAPAGEGSGTVWRRVAATMRFAALISGLLFVLLATITVLDIAGRILWNQNLENVSTLVPLATVAAGYLTLAQAGISRVHVRTPILTSRLPARAAALLRALGLVLTVAFLGFVVYYTAERAYESWLVGENSLGIDRIPVWPARVAIPVGLLGLLFVEVRRLVEVFDWRKAAVAGRQHNQPGGRA